MLFWKLEVVHKASSVQKPYRQAAGDVVLSCDKWLPAVISGKKEQLSDVLHPASQGTVRAHRRANTVVPMSWARSWEHWPCRVGGRVWLDVCSIKCHSQYYGANSCRATLHWSRWSSVITESFLYSLGCSWSGWSYLIRPSLMHCAYHIWPGRVMNTFFWVLIVFLN